MAKAEKGFSVFSVVSKDIGIDLGTANTVLYMRDKGIILREASAVAIDARTDEVIAAGKEAKEMLGKTHENIQVVCPVERGVIAHYGACVAMLRHYLHKAASSGFVNKPRIVVSVPSGITDVERRAVEDAVKQSGAGSVNLMEAPLAAAIGVGLPIGAARGEMILSVGAGITECAVVALGDIVASATSRHGSSDLDRSVMKYMKKKYSLNIGPLTAEEIKLKIGSVFPSDDSFNSFMDVKGRSTEEGLPKSITVQADEMREVFYSEAASIVKVITDVMAETPPELAADILENGVMVTGGGSQLKGLDKFIEQETGIKAVTAERPVDCTAEGLGKSLDLVFSGRDIRKTRRIGKG